MGFVKKSCTSVGYIPQFSSYRSYHNVYFPLIVDRIFYTNDSIVHCRGSRRATWAWGDQIERETGSS